MKTFTLLFLVLFCFLLASCSQAEDDVVTEQIVSIEVISPIFPPVVGEGDLVLRLTHTASGVPIDDAYLAVKGDMDHDGMMPVLTSAKVGADGEYVIPFEWTMGGDWIVTVNAALADGTQVVQDFNLVVDGDDVSCLPIAQE